MVYAISAVLVLLWVVGTATSHVAGGYIDILLIVASITIMLNFIGRRHAI